MVVSTQTDNGWKQPEDITTMNYWKITNVKNNF